MIRAFLGGSFDPIHRGHVAMVAYVLANADADFVHIVPAWQSPFKDRTNVPAVERLAMVHLAFAGHRNVAIEEDEIAAERTCYTVDTLAALQARYEAERWLLLIGGDHLAGLAGWRQAARLQDLATIVVLGRDEIDLSRSAIRAAQVAAGRVVVRPDFREPVSSTAIRALLDAPERSFAGLKTGGLPGPVARYILDRQLYLPQPDGADLVPDSD